MLVWFKIVFKKFKIKNIIFWDRVKKYSPYIFIVVGSIVAFLGNVYSNRILFFIFSFLGLIIAFVGQFISDFLSKKIDVLKEEEILKKKLTSPKFIINLRYINSRNYLILIQSENLIPIKFKVCMLNQQNIYYSGLQIDWAEIYPTKELRNFSYRLNLNKDPESTMNLKFDYESIWFSELNKKELAGSLVQTYQINNDSITYLKEQYIF